MKFFENNVGLLVLVCASVFILAAIAILVIDVVIYKKLRRSIKFWADTLRTLSQDVSKIKAYVEKPPTIIDEPQVRAFRPGPTEIFGLPPMYSYDRRTEPLPRRLMTEDEKKMDPDYNPDGM